MLYIQKHTRWCHDETHKNIYTWSTGYEKHFLDTFRSIRTVDHTVFHKYLIKQTNTEVFTKNESVNEIDHDTPMFTFGLKRTEPSPPVDRHCEDPRLLRSEVYGPLPHQGGLGMWMSRHNHDH